MEQMKTLESLHFGDLERPQVSKYHIQKPRFNVYVFKAKCSSFYLNKSSNTADTTAYDTFCTENPSVSYLDIPSERMQNRIITTYDDYLEKAKDSKENKENQFEAPIRTEDSERKTFSFKSGRRSNSAQVRSRAASRYRDCSPDPKTKEFNTSSSCILNRRGSKDAVICNFQKRMDFEKENEKSPTKSPMRTPKLGTLNSTSSFPFGTRESSQTVLRERKNFSNQEEYAKDPIKELKMMQEEAMKEKEALKTKIMKLKKKIKDEEAKKFEVQVNSQNLDNASQRITKRSKIQEKKCITAKTQIHNLRKEIITILQQNDEDKMGIEYFQENIANEHEIVSQYKEDVKNMRQMILEENKEKERIREQIEKSRKTLVKLHTVFENLINESDKYAAFLEEKHARSKIILK